MRYLVTGATGGLGRNAVEALLAQGLPVRATGRNAQVGHQLATAGAEFVPLDLCTASHDQLHALTRGVDIVWHCAALSAPWGAREAFLAINARATERLLVAAGSAGVTRLVHVSTPAVYFDFQHRLNVAEDFRPAAYVNAYASSKALAEEAVARATTRFPRMRCVILRPRAIFGRYDQVLLPRLLDMHARLNGRLALPRGGQAQLDLTFAENVVHAMTLASSGPQLRSGDVFNITNQQPGRLCDAVRQLFAALGRPCRIVPVPYPLLAAAARLLQLRAALDGREPALTAYSAGAMAYDLTLDNTRAQQVLGYYPPVALEEGIERTGRWTACHG